MSETSYISGCCYRCKGTGRITYPALDKVLEAISPDGWLSSDAIAETLDRDPFHVRTQLRQLLDLGLVERRRNGKRGGPYQWRRKA